MGSTERTKYFPVEMCFCLQADRFCLCLLIKFRDVMTPLKFGVIVMGVSEEYSRAADVTQSAIIFRYLHESSRAPATRF
jgi:hypothetical protein